MKNITCRAELQMIGAHADTIELYADSAEENMKKLDTSIKTITLVKKLREAEKDKNDTEISEAKKKLAEHLKKEVDELDNESISAAQNEAGKEIDTVKKEINFGIKDDGTLYPLSEDEKKSMKVKDFANIYKYAKEHKVDMVTSLETRKGDLNSKLENIEKSKASLSNDVKEYETLKTQLELPLKALDIYVAKANSLSAEKEAMEKELSAKTEKDTTDMEESPLSPDYIDALITLYGITTEEAVKMGLELKNVIDNENNTPNKKEKEEIGG